MAVEMNKDYRKVIIREDGKYVLSAEQEQVYDPENVEHMLADWAKKAREIEEWLGKFDQHLEDGKKLLVQQLEKQRAMLEAELDSIRQGEEMWKNARRREDQGGS